MGIIDNIRNLFNPNYQKDLVEQIQDELTKESGFKGDIATWQSSVGIPPTASRREILEHYKSWVFANTNAIAEPVSDIEFKLYRKARNDDVIEIKTHEILELLNRVNNYTTKHDLIFMTVQYLLLQGEAAWFLSKSDDSRSKKPKEIIVLDPSQLKIFPNKEKGGVEFYELQLKSGEKIRFEADEILFMRKPNPQSQFRGIGVVEAVFTTIQSDDFAEEWNRNFYYNSARPDGVLKTEQKLNEDTRKRLMTAWESQFRGVRHARKNAILEAGLDYKVIQPSATDMDFLNLQKWNRDKIMALFSNTKVALGIVEDVNRANAEASEYVHTKNTIRPMMQFITDSLNEFLVPKFRNDIFLGFEDPVTQDREALVKEWTAGWNKWLTINEIRDEQGFEEIDGGDSLYLPINLLPIGSEGAESEAKTIIKELKVKTNKRKQKRLKKRYSKEIQRIKNRDVEKTKQELALREVAKDIVNLTKKKKKLIKNKVLIQDMKPEERIKYMENFWKGLVREASPYEKKFVRDMRKRIYPVLEKEVIDKLNKSQKDTHIKANVDRFLFDKKKAIELSIIVLIPLLREIVMFGGKKGMNLAGVNLEYIETSAFIQGYLRNNTKKFSKAYTTEATRQIRATLAEGLKNKEGLDLLTKRVRNTFGRLSENQAWRIARTETFKAINASTIDAWRQTGIVEGKQWFTAMDERVCEFCTPMDGKVFGFEQTIHEKDTDLLGNAGGKLDLSYESIEFPPLHANCRCTVSPIIVGTKDNLPEKTKLKKMVEDIIKEYDEPEEDCQEAKK